MPGFAYWHIRCLEAGRVMITGLFSQPNYVAAKKLLDAAVLRHGAITSNLANVETPNYKRLDVAPSFQAQLQEAIQGQNPNQLGAVQPRLEVDANVSFQLMVEVRNRLLDAHQELMRMQI